MYKCIKYNGINNSTIDYMQMTVTYMYNFGRQLP